MFQRVSGGEGEFNLVVEIIPRLCCCWFINEASDPPASVSPEELLLAHLIHNK